MKPTTPKKGLVQSKLSFSPNGVLQAARTPKPVFRPFSEKLTPIHPSAVLKNNSTAKWDDTIQDDLENEEGKPVRDVPDNAPKDDAGYHTDRTEVDSNPDEAGSSEAMDQGKQRTLPLEGGKRKREGSSRSDSHGSKTPTSRGSSRQHPRRDPANLQFLHHDLSNPNDTQERDEWNKHFVRLPCSPRHTIICGDSPSGPKSPVKFSKWQYIVNVLSSPIKNADDLLESIFSYNPNQRHWEFWGLKYYLDQRQQHDDTLFTFLIPGMARLALHLPILVPQPIPLLKEGHQQAITLTQMQIACLLANAFFCSFPQRAYSSTYPTINFERLYRGEYGISSSTSEKLTALLHYFHRVLEKEPQGKVTFFRRVVPLAQFRESALTAAAAPLSSLDVKIDGTIEDHGQDLIQADFGNKYLGGGVLGEGCVQEEILFIIYPELLVSRLFTEVLANDEVVLITGAERFSSYTGYSNTFQFAGSFVDTRQQDDMGRRATRIIAMDAINFRGKSDSQYQSDHIVREVSKAYIAFGAAQAEQTAMQHSGVAHFNGVATGHWGCGAFGGDKELKALIQLIAASLVHAEHTPNSSFQLRYFTFGDADFSTRFQTVYDALVKANVPTSRLVELICASDQPGDSAQGVFDRILDHLQGCNLREGFI
ncbi:hypothetical protein DFS34DRAFT_231111 [Phlyctochytrium arcticum]|nr:hypothetical protein DFS34DRAFT_231111 [Phlyctochytrium arcticum]